jgi:UDP-GlcNAc:undecaprenyl-phosphate GlcNAc-1-phosphate transferase
MTTSELMLLFSLLLGSFLLTYIIMPKIIGVVTYMCLMDTPDQRSSHKELTPSLGGISFYIVLVFSLFFIDYFNESENAMTLIPGLLILFIIGLKDDLVVLSPVTKLFAQLASVSFVLINPEFQIQSLHGFFGITQLSPFLSLPLSAFVMLTIINSFNLIDGIDGLASIVGIVIFTITGTLFYLLHLFLFVGISAVMIGSLVAFLRFNFSTKRKIFMGDTGSLLIGFIIASAVIRLFAIKASILNNLPFHLENLPLVIMAILIVPFFDTARVFTIRVINKQGPFSPDRNHIHHILIDYLNLSHKKASVIIGIVNILFILIFMLLGASIDNFYLLIFMVIAILGLVYFFYRVNFSYKNLRYRLWVKKILRKILFLPQKKSPKKSSL